MSASASGAGSPPSQGPQQSARDRDRPLASVRPHGQRLGDESERSIARSYRAPRSETSSVRCGLRPLAIPPTVRFSARPFRPPRRRSAPEDSWRPAAPAVTRRTCSLRQRIGGSSSSRLPQRRPPGRFQDARLDFGILQAQHRSTVAAPVFGVCSHGAPSLVKRIRRAEGDDMDPPRALQPVATRPSAFTRTRMRLAPGAHRCRIGLAQACPAERVDPDTEGVSGLADQG